MKEEHGHAGRSEAILKRRLCSAESLCPSTMGGGGDKDCNVPPGTSCLAKKKAGSWRLPEEDHGSKPSLLELPEPQLWSYNPS